MLCLKIVFLIWTLLYLHINFCSISLKKKCHWQFFHNCTESIEFLESPLGYKEIKSVNPKGNQSWIFIGRTDAKAEAPILWPPDLKSWIIRKDSDGGKDWRQEEKGWQRTRWWDVITNSMDMNLSNSGRWWRTGKPGIAAVHGATKGRIQLNDWTTTTIDCLTVIIY